MGFLLRIKAWAGKKVIVAAVGYVLCALKAKHPDWPLPGEDFTKDLLLALLGAHTVTDLMAIAKTAGKEVIAGKAAQ